MFATRRRSRARARALLHLVGRRDPSACSCRPAARGGARVDGFGRFRRGPAVARPAADGILRWASGRYYVSVRPVPSLRGAFARPAGCQATVLSDRPLCAPVCDAIALGTLGTRLETRTKESSMCASHWDIIKPKGEMKVKVRVGRGFGRGSRPWEDGRACVPASHSRGVSLCSLRAEAHPERTRWDPKDGELCPVRTKSGETLMEVRSDSDVQIDRRNWV